MHKKKREPGSPSRLPISRAAVPAACLMLSLVPHPGTPLSAQVSLSPEHERIDFLVGEWRTSSQFPDGTTAEGELTYRWVLGGGWMQVVFVGQAPDGGFWETYAMQRWNPESGAYESLVFRDGGPPVRYRGHSPEPGRYEIEGQAADGTLIGIDYQATEDGAVYQENWALVDGERRVTLRTTYRPAREESR
jgi:hypothetical protein